MKIVRAAVPRRSGDSHSVCTGADPEGGGEGGGRGRRGGEGKGGRGGGKAQTSLSSVLIILQTGHLLSTLPDSQVTTNHAPNGEHL